MHPGLLIIGAGIMAFFAFRRKPLSDAERATAMTRLPDLLFKIITKAGTPDDRASWAREAIELAVALAMPKTAQGIATGAGLPADEIWPGTSVPVPKYISAYVDARKPKALPAKGGKKYNDEGPYPPYESPQKVRAQAVNAERTNGAQAKVLHIKADTLNTMIRAAKLKAAGATAVSALTSLVRR